MKLANTARLFTTGLVLAALAMAVLVVGLPTRPVTAAGTTARVGGAAAADTTVTNVLVVFGTVFERDGLTPSTDADTVVVTNLRTRVSASSPTGAVEPSKYSVVFLDFEWNDAAAVGDTLVFRLLHAPLLSSDCIVVNEGDVSARQLRLDLVVDREPTPTRSVTWGELKVKYRDPAQPRSVRNQP